MTTRSVAVRIINNNVMVGQTTTIPPRAIVLMLCGLGVDQKHMEFWTDWYTNDLKCHVVTAKSPVGNFFLAQHRSLKSTAQVISDEALKLLANNDDDDDNDNDDNNNENDSNNTHNLPILIHACSNGGCFIVEELDRLWKEQQQSYKVLTDNLQTHIFDSTPCYLHMPWDLSRFWNDAFVVPTWSPTFRNAYLLGSAISLSTWCMVTFSPYRAKTFHDTMQYHLYSPNQVYIFTTADVVTDTNRIHDIINYRRQNNLSNIEVVQEYHDSGHVRLHVDHPQDYLRIVNESIQNATNRHGQTNSK